jgi:exopolyphosphatase/guanosine-5'-triphosphate,3'-diphosphate pyrophosphatase
VARLARDLYDGLAASGVVTGDDAERELLWAASMLHDVGMAIRYDDHHKHSEYLIRNAGLPGFAPREVALVARIARYHRKGTPSLGDLEPVSGSGDGRRLALLAGLVRLAEQLERSRDQSVREVRVSSRKGEVRIEVDAGGDGTVALWSARGSADLLADRLQRRVLIEAA